MSLRPLAESFDLSNARRAAYAAEWLNLIEPTGERAQALADALQRVREIELREAAQDLADREFDRQLAAELQKRIDEIEARYAGAPISYEVNR